MKNPIRSLLLLCACLIGVPCLALAAGEPAMPPLDPANPALLNEYAMAKVRDGDVGTAAILLERAALLAPYDTRIRHNLDVLRAWQDGKPAPAQTAAAPPATPRAARADSDPGAPPFPLWPEHSHK